MMQRRDNVLVTFCTAVEQTGGTDFKVEFKWDSNIDEPKAKLPLTSMHQLLNYSPETIKFKQLIFDDSKVSKNGDVYENIIPLNDENMEIINNLQCLRLKRLTFKLTWIKKYAIISDKLFNNKAYIKIRWGPI